MKFEPFRYNKMAQILISFLSKIWPLIYLATNNHIVHGHSLIHNLPEDIEIEELRTSLNSVQPGIIHVSIEHYLIFFADDPFKKKCKNLDFPTILFYFTNNTSIEDKIDIFIVIK